MIARRACPALTLLALLTLAIAMLGAAFATMSGRMELLALCGLLSAASVRALFALAD